MLYKLESLRGIAAILVVLHHIDWGNGSNWFIKNSLLFVDFFFVLSGFVISLAYTQKINKGMSFFYYFGLRLARLYPLHFFVMILWLPYMGAKYYLYSSGFGGVDPALTENAKSFFVVLFLLNSVGFLDYLSWNVPSWSIGAEIIAYAYFFFTIYTVKKFNLSVKWIFLFISILCYVLIYLIKGPHIAQITEWAFLRCIGAFSLGCVVFRIFNSSHSKLFVNLHEYLSILLVILSVTLVGVSQYFAYVAVVVFAYTIYVYAHQESGLLGKLLETPVAKALGRWSYSIYMVHMLFVSSISDFFEHILKLGHKNIPWIGYWCINTAVLAIIILFASMTYRWIELPCRNYFRKKLDKHYLPVKN